MANDAITVHNLSKRYRIGLQEEMHDTLAGALSAFVRRPLQNFRNLRNLAHFDEQEQGIIWAIKDVSFTVQQGDVVGIIGRNGSGKSTLLKILSCITEPTSGEAIIYGRVSSLLEVGTGFHPELTGRENIYLNGTILGMRKGEIDQKFDEIVDFSGVEKFIDTPVKRYSSGMQVRLAFAVAAHLEPEILIIDEVLAVGDIAFQQKCIGKMQDVSTSGRTVLFVSHNMHAILSFCTTAMLLRDGQLVRYDATRPVVDIYLQELRQYAIGTAITPDMHTFYPPGLEITRVALLNQKDESVDRLLMNEAFRLRISYRINEPEVHYRIGVRLRSSDEVLLTEFLSNNNAGEPYYFAGEPDTMYEVTIQSKNVLLPGRYAFELIVKTSQRERVDLIQGLSFTVDSVSVDNESARYTERGFVRMQSIWELPVANVSGSVEY